MTEATETPTAATPKRTRKPKEAAAGKVRRNYEKELSDLQTRVNTALRMMKKAHEGDAQTRGPLLELAIEELGGTVNGKA